ncbi:Protein NRT1/ PTR family 2.13 [Vitis vinifera]|uniref:Protein NRT1/ PTR family 2.13 n=1 Tax=Vitis vinifera TaxID=29760 RepID=A0A438D767_VITVI|nr:Protein NRT1/ PTR family 2.13 [Vitis vinifera]
MSTVDAKHQASPLTSSWSSSPPPKSKPLDNEPEKSKHDAVVSSDVSDEGPRKPGGWNSMVYILGNETFERLATFGLLANFMVYLLNEFHLDQVYATNVLNIWSGTTNFAPLVGAFISDACVGRFRTIAFASFASLLGMVTLTLTSWIPQLHPPSCTEDQQQNDQCTGPTSAQMGILFLGLGFLTIGTGGIRPCSIPFGVDQFDPTTEQGRRGINSFYNWLWDSYIAHGGFHHPVLPRNKGLRVREAGGQYIFRHCTSFVAAYKKRRVKIPVEGEKEGAYYDPPLTKGSIVAKLPFTKRFRWLNKAAVILEGEKDANGCPSNQWRLCSIQQVEEVKCLLKIIPVWASGIICFTAISQQGTFTVSQALKMDRHLGPKFQIPAGSLIVISMLTVGIWVPFYDRLVERERRASAILQAGPHGIAPMSVMWLAPQLILMGFAEAFNIIGQIEFYNKEFPENMRSIANSLFFCTIAGASYLSSLVVVIVHDVTGKAGRSAWLTKNINQGKVDYYYYLLAGMGVLNLIYFLFCARRYRYKSGHGVTEEEPHLDLELNQLKH